MNQILPTGRIAFYISPENQEIVYSIVRVKGRYDDLYDVIELPRGDPDHFYINPSLADSDPHYRIVVEHSKEQYALDRLGILEVGDPLTILAAHGYKYERTESLEEAGMRELKEEHGFDVSRHTDMVRQLITMRPFPVKANYGSMVEYRSFLQIEGNVQRIQLQRTEKIERKAPLRLGVSYVEEGGWASLREIRENAAGFVTLRSVESGADSERRKGEANYQKSIADWMESAEAALVGILRGQRVPVNTTSFVNPATAIRSTGAEISSSISILR